MPTVGPTPTPTEEQPKVSEQEAYVYNTEGLGLFVREAPSTSANKIGGFNEGQKLPGNGFRNNAHTWWDDNIRIGKYKYGSEAREGAIAVWGSSMPYSGGAGHVAVVEKIENGTVYVSQSAYMSYNFKYSTLSNSNYLLGYIYVDQPNY